MSVSGWFFGTKNPLWPVEQRCSRSPGETLNSGRVNPQNALGGGVRPKSSCVHLGPLAIPQTRLLGGECLRLGNIISQSSQLLEADRWDSLRPL